MDNNTEKSYDAVAGDYAQQYNDELVQKPFDQKLLSWLIEKVGPGKTICDMGCGPGQVARHLHDCGAESYGIDVSHEMVVHARQLHPGIEFQQTDMLDLNGIPAERFGGIAAFYSIIHIPHRSVFKVLEGFHRVLSPHGAVLLTHHIGSELVHRDDWWGKEISLDFQFFETAEMKSYLQQAGFLLEEVIERDPYPQEYQSRRAYIFARKK